MPTESEQLKDAGVDQVAANNEAWMSQASDLIDSMAAAGIEFTADDLRLCMDRPANPNCVGAAFRIASRAGKIRFVRYQKATSRLAHARAIAVWIGA